MYYSEPVCAVYDENGECVCLALAADGTCVRPALSGKLLGLGDDTASTAGMTPWLVGGVLIALAAGAYALEKKGPAPFRRSRA